MLIPRYVTEVALQTVRGLLLHGKAERVNRSSQVVGASLVLPLLLRVQTTPCALNYLLCPSAPLAPQRLQCFTAVVQARPCWAVVGPEPPLNLAH